tara:strand:- start:685 stop:831 length:147 start_codon:yes stop_codon:yes gene_type:complete
MTKLLEIFNGLSKRGKILTGFALIIVAIAVIELFSGCSNIEAVKTWKF